MTRRLTLLLLVPIILFVFVSPAFAKGEAVSVYYAGEADSSVMRALELAGFTLVDDPAQAQVILLNGSIPDAGALAVQVQAGKGLVLILGEGSPPRRCRDAARFSGDARAARRSCQPDRDRDR